MSQTQKEKIRRDVNCSYLSLWLNFSGPRLLAAPDEKQQAFAVECECTNPYRLTLLVTYVRTYIRYVRHFACVRACVQVETPAKAIAIARGCGPKIMWTSFIIPWQLRSLSPVFLLVRTHAHTQSDVRTVCTYVRMLPTE
jgi:hypothetical protein